jgi:hypothetical protein
MPDVAKAGEQLLKSYDVAARFAQPTKKTLETLYLQGGKSAALLLRLSQASMQSELPYTNQRRGRRSSLYVPSQRLHPICPDLISDRHRLGREPAQLTKRVGTLMLSYDW